MAEIDPISHEELEVREEETVDGFTATRVLKCTWEDRVHLSMDLVSGDAGFGRIYPHREIAGARALRVGVVGFTGHDPAAQVNIQQLAYEFARLTVQYSTPTSSSEQIAGGGHSGGIIERFEPSVQMHKLDHRLYKWGSAAGRDVRPNEAPARMELGMDYTLSRTRQTSVPDNIFNPIGGVNKFNFSLPTFGVFFLPESLLYRPPAIEHSYNPRSGTGLFNITWRLSYRSPNWNTYWRADKFPNGGYERIVTLDGGEVFNYPKVDFGTYVTP